MKHFMMYFQVTAILALALVGFAGCSSRPGEISPNVEANDGSSLTTSPGEPLKEAWLLGKWDVDGERTNTANGASGVGAIPSDIFKDVLGDGWKFEPNGVVKIDAAGGYRRGSYTLAGDQVTVVYSGQPDGITYTDVHFRSGYLYMKKPDGRWIVFEKNKYFGF